MIPYERYHGAGNDFLLIDARANDVTDRRTLAIRAGDRERGAGVDGVLFLSLSPDAAPPRVEMALVQPDGSTAAMCGNGARCAATWAAERTGADTIAVDTPAGARLARVDADAVTVEMGRASFDPADVPLNRDDPLVDAPVEGVAVTAVNTGVPHAVAFVDAVDGIDLPAVAPPIRRADVFAEGANVTFAARSGAGFDQRTFERGVEGETLACGTGAVAIAAVAVRRGLAAVDEPIPVSPPGGDLEIVVRADDTATLRGPVARTGAGELAPEEVSP